MTASPTELLVPLSLLQPSTTNPRKRIDNEALAALAESVAEHEVMQPVLARPHPAPVSGGAKLEIVAGERRWRACGLLGERNPHQLPGVEGTVSAIPCLVRDLTDAQVLAMQLVENIARVDLHPLEEAEHYQRMRQDPKAPARVEDIAHLAKVSESRVYERLSLLHLVPAAREAFLAEKLSLKTALLVARMPAAQQPEIVRHLADWAGEPMSPKAAARFIRDTFMLRLAGAPFPLNDAELVPEAGACGACPKRSGANPQLFADISEDDTCTDRTCFESKRAAQRARLLDELRTTGYQVLEGEAARAACTPDGRDLKPGLVSLEASVPAHIGDPATRVADVLERAKVPTTDVKAIAHPLVTNITLAVPTGRLEDALRRLKAHREQQQPPSPPPAPATPSTPPAPPGVTQSAAKAAQTLAAPAQWPFPGERESRAAPAQLHDHWPEPDSARALLMQEALAFEPPAYCFTGKNSKGHLDRYREEQAARGRAIVAAVLAGGAATSRRASLSRLALVRILLVNLVESGATWVRFNEACAIAGVALPDALREPQRPGPEGLSRHAARMHWLWQLPADDAEALCTVLAASQEGDTSGDSTTPLNVMPEYVLADLRIDASRVAEHAQASVDEILRLAALKHGAPAPAAKKAAPTKAKKAAAS